MDQLIHTNITYSLAVSLNTRSILRQKNDSDKNLPESIFKRELSYCFIHEDTP